MKIFLNCTALTILTATTAFAELDYEPMAFFPDGTELMADGVIDASTLDNFAQVISSNPDADTIVLEYVSGSADDESNLKLSLEVQNAAFMTVVPSDGLVASGGTDLFLAGADRILEEGACVGVHSWAGDNIQGGDIPRDSNEHAPYLAYYQSIKIQEEFYWFTLGAARSDGMHWMTQAEADQFGISTEPAPVLGTQQECDAR